VAKKTKARALQRLAEDEIGMRPRLTVCYDVLRASVREPGRTDEEHLARVFLANSERLRQSAYERAEERGRK